MPGPDPRFDRVAPPDTKRVAQRDGTGKEALYTTSPEAPATAPVTIECERCGTQRRFSVRDAASMLLRPPIVVNPLRRSGRVWARCPACEKRSWVRFHVVGTLGAWLDRDNRD